MLETHPFGDFVPQKAQYLLLGSFTTKEAFDPNKQYDWFYSNGRNQFWPIMEQVYGVDLPTRKDKEKLFRKLRMALADIIYQCERKKNSNLDMNLCSIVYNLGGVERIIRDNRIKKIFFTSRFVEGKFKRLFKHLITEFPEMQLVTLPSPSPRYAQMTRDEKIKRYRALLPRI